GAGTFVTASDSTDGTRLATVSVRVRRKLAACALPRPSATASAKFANSTVSQSQSAICPENRAAPCCIRSRPKRIVAIRAATAVTKITGLRASQRGSSFLNASPIAGPTIASAKMEGTGLRGISGLSVELAAQHREMLRDWPKRKRGEKGQPAHDQND